MIPPHLKGNENKTSKAELDHLSDSMLSQLLSYKNDIIDQAFINKLMKKVNRIERLRNGIILISVLLGIFNLNQTSLEAPLSFFKELEFSFLQKIGESISAVPVDSFSTIILSIMLMLAVSLTVLD